MLPRYSFYGCTALKTIKFSENATLATIGDYGFYDCLVLHTADMSNCNQVTKIGASAFQSSEADMHISKCQIGPLDVTLEEKVLLEFVKANPKATQEQIAKHIGKSSRTVKRITASLYGKGYLKRENGKRNGVWITIEYR